MAMTMASAGPMETAGLISDSSRPNPQQRQQHAVSTSSAAGAMSVPSGGTSAGGMLSPFASHADTSPNTAASVLAATLVRSRATYFERLSSGARATTSGFPGLTPGGGGGSGGGASSANDTYQTAPPTPRHSSASALSPHPLHPLAPHPLAGGGGGGGGMGSLGGLGGLGLSRCGSMSSFQSCSAGGGSWREEELMALVDAMDSGGAEGEGGEGGGGGGGGGGEEEGEDDGPAFFDRPSWSCGLGNKVELSQAAAGHRQGHQGPAQAQQQQGRGRSTPGQRLVTARGGAGGGGIAMQQQPPSSCGGAGTAPPGSSPPAGEGVMASYGSGGYVRSLSQRFGRVSSSSWRGGPGGGAAGMDGLFDDLVTHVGALLASHPDVEAQMGMVQGLSDRLLELHDVCETLERKEDEVEHLRGVLRELTMTRAEAIRLKVQMAETLNGLQSEYYKCLRSAHAARAAAATHAARSVATRKQLQDCQADLLRHKRAVAALRDRNRRLRAENEELSVRVAGMEHVRPDVRRSACYRELLEAQTPVLY